MKFAVVFEKGDDNYSVYVPDLPGCVATGATLEEAKQMIREAIEFHLEGMLLHGETIPPATTQCGDVEVNAEQIVSCVPSVAVNPGKVPRS
jgi:predicted RNase H-like HicB family nuclease